jgi:hypothetical protein
MRGGIEALKVSICTGHDVGGDQGALRPITRRKPVTNRPNWNIPRFIAEKGLESGRSQLSRALRKKFCWRAQRHKVKGHQIAGKIIVSV